MSLRRVGEGAEEVLLQLVGVLEQGEGLVGVGGDDDAIEPADPVVGRAHVDAAIGPTDRAHAAAGVDPVTEPLAQGEHVLMAPTDDRAPLLPPEPEHAVVVEEPDGMGGGEVEHLVGCRRPERRGDRHQELADEAVAVALVGDVLAQARRVVCATSSDRFEVRSQRTISRHSARYDGRSRSAGSASGRLLE